MYISRGSHAFALPTVLIASIVMMLILLSGLTALVSTRTAQLASYETRLTKEASESGMSFAKACMAANGNKVTWTNSKPLKPNTDCTGTESIACTNTSTDARCFVVNQGNYRTSFEVTYTANASNVITDIASRGITSTVRSTSKATASYKTEVTKAKVSGGGSITSTNQSAPKSKQKYLTTKYSTNGYLSETCAIASGQVYCFGSGTANNSGGAPSLINGMSGKTVTDITLDVTTSGNPAYPYLRGCAIADGQVYCWNYAHYADPGVGYSTASVVNTGGLSGKTAGRQQANSNSSAPTLSPY